MPDEKFDLSCWDCCMWYSLSPFW